MKLLMHVRVSVDRVNKKTEGRLTEVDWIVGLMRCRSYKEVSPQNSRTADSQKLLIHRLLQVKNERIQIVSCLKW